MKADPAWVLDHAPYTPFMHDRTAGPPGLSPLDPATWTVRDPDFGAQMERRRQVLRDHAEVVLGALNVGEEAGIELLELVLAHLGDARELTLAEQFCPLTALGNLVAEDFCLLLPDDKSGEYKLVAAILCFPARWLLSEKMNRPLTIIHDPVPDYDETLARRVNRVFEALRPDRPLVRVNWLVYGTAELFLPLGLSDKLMEDAAISERLYLRTERQTLVKLPRTGSVAFGIKTSVTPIDCLSRDEAAGLLGRLHQIHPERIAYSSRAVLIDEARRQLAEIAGE